MSRPALVLCEDAHARTFHPLTDTRPVFELRAGIFSARERLARAFPDHALTVLARPGVGAAFAATSGLACGWIHVPDGAVLVNGRILGGNEWHAVLGQLRPGQAATVEGEVAAARIPPKMRERCVAAGVPWPAELLAELEAVPAAGEWLRHPWDLVSRNPDWIARDAAAFALGSHAGTVAAGAHLERGDRIHLAAGSKVEPGCFLDATGGPIVLAAGAWAQSHTRIEGPCYVGPNTQLLGGRIGEGTSLGPECRIAGEIEESVVQGYSNKRHHGFVGHSYLGEWVNLGALTTTSDLKNNYGPVRMWHDGAMKDTGLMKLGSLVGDHSKTAIGTLLGTGTVVGVMSNVFRVSPPSRVGSFRWVGASSEEAHRWDKARALLATVMSRRGLRPSPETVALYEALAGEAGAI